MENVPEDFPKKGIFPFKILLLWGIFFSFGFFPKAWAQAPVLDIRVDSRENLCYVATGEPGGLYRFSPSDFSNLGGRIPEKPLYSLSLSPQGDLLLATFEEVLLSRNRGESWGSLKGGGEFKNFYVTRKGTFLGVSWKRGLLWASPEKPEMQQSSGDMGNFLVTGVLENSLGMLWAGTFGGGVFFSSDGGRSWEPIEEGLENPFVLSLAWNASEEVLYAGTYRGGVYRKVRENSWEPFSRGLPEYATVQALEMDERGRLWGGTYREGCFVNPLGGGEWRPFSKGNPPLSITCLAPFSDGMLGGTDTGKLLFAPSESAAWIPLNFSNPFTGFAETQSGKLYALSRSGVFYASPDGGKSWKEEGSMESAFPCNALTALLEESFLAGTSRGTWLSEDRGKSWIFRSFPEIPERESSNEFSPPSGERGDLVGMVRQGFSLVAATRYKGLFRSSQGWSWEFLGGSEAVEGEYVSCITSDGGSRLALGTERGLSFSLDGGESWENIYVNYGISSALFDESGTLWGVSRNGLWRFSLSEKEAFRASIKGYEWSPFAYFTEIFPGEKGLLGILRDSLVRLDRTSEGEFDFLLQSSSLRNVNVRSYLRSSSGKLLLGTERGFYLSEDGGDRWTEGTLPLGIFHLFEKR